MKKLVQIPKNSVSMVDKSIQCSDMVSHSKVYQTPKSMVDKSIQSSDTIPRSISTPKPKSKPNLKRSRSMDLSSFSLSTPFLPHLIALKTLNCFNVFSKKMQGLYRIPNFIQHGDNVHLMLYRCYERLKDVETTLYASIR